MNVVSVLGEASAIQWQGIIDQTEATLYTGLANGLVIGQFRRGRSDKPMLINSSNIKKLLGYDPTNPSYIAVQGILDQQVAEIQVLNLGSIGATV